MKTIVPRKQLNRTLNSGERQVAVNHEEIDYWHKWRYQIARDCLPMGSIVGDFGCGIGYGSKILSEKATTVYGFDDSEETIEFAKKHNKTDWIHYKVLDLEHDKIPCEVDTAVVYEVLEHLQDPIHFLKEIERVTNRFLFLSVPHKSVDLELSEFHYRHYEEQEVEAIVKSIGFKVCQLKLMQFTKGLAVFCIAEKEAKS